jgi:hypothetical protein
MNSYQKLPTDWNLSWKGRKKAIAVSGEFKA